VKSVPINGCGNLWYEKIKIYGKDMFLLGMKSKVVMDNEGACERDESEED